MRHRLTILLALIAALISFPPMGAAEWAELDAADAALRDADRETRLLDRMIDALGPLLPDDAEADLAAARARARAADGAVEAARAATADLRARLQTAQRARDARFEQLLGEAPRWRAAERRLADASALADGLAAKGSAITDDELRRWIAARHDADALRRAFTQSRQAWWLRTELVPLHAAVDPLYKQVEAAGRDQALAAAHAAAKEARRTVEGIEKRLVHASPRGAALLAKRVESTTARTAAASRLAQVRKALLGDREWQWEASLALPPKKNGKPAAAKASLWIPPGVAAVRGVIIGHPPMLGASLTRDAQVRIAAARSGLAVVVTDIDGFFNYAGEAPRRLQALLADLAVASKHPELEQAPLLTIGHSTSGIFARNVGSWKPERVIGVIHIKSGNLHQHRPDPARTLVGVPFLAINGEFEEFGPEGGIRGDYGAQTQWIMMREQLLRWRAQDASHLVSLIVHPGGDHTSWSSDLSRLCATFIRATAARRLPPAGSPAGTPLIPLRPEDGWLSDAALDEPRHPAAPWNEYAGDRAKAFWHIDGDMVQAVSAFHHERFLLPDPSREHPVPEKWGR